MNKGFKTLEVAAHLQISEEAARNWILDVQEVTGTKLNVDGANAIDAAQLDLIRAALEQRGSSEKREAALLRVLHNRRQAENEKTLHLTQKSIETSAHRALTIAVLEPLNRVSAVLEESKAHNEALGKVVGTVNQTLCAITDLVDDFPKPKIITTQGWIVLGLVGGLALTSMVLGLNEMVALFSKVVLSITKGVGRTLTEIGNFKLFPTLPWTMLVLLIGYVLGWHFSKR